MLLDGAHNPAGAAALAQAIDDLQPHLARGPRTLVTAVMADKDVDGIIDALAGASALLGATMIATTVDTPRAMPADDLAARWRARAPRLGDVIAVPDPLEAVDRGIGARRHGRRLPGRSTSSAPSVVTSSTTRSCATAVPS